MKKLLSAILSLTMIFAFSSQVLASNGTNDFSVNAKVATVVDVSETGENLNDDTMPSSNATTKDIPITISHNNNSVQISANLNNEDVLISGVPAAHSANQHAVFFEATTNNPNYEVVHFEYVDNTNTNMYFKTYANEINPNQILKVYLRDTGSTTRDYLILECFDFNLPNFSTLLSSTPQDTVMGAWAAKEFSPISSSYQDVSPFLDTSNTERTYTVEYYDMGSNQTHTITIATDCTYGDVLVGQMADIVYRVEITGKTMTVDNNSSINSSTESFLHVDAAALSQTSVPNTAFISTSIDGIVQNNSIFGGSLSANIGVNYGILGASISIPLSFSSLSPVDIDETYDSFVNGRDGEYTRSIKTTMKDNFKLTQIGYYFEVRSTIGDFGNVSKGDNFHKAKWNLSIINAGNMTTQAKTINQNVRVAIVD